MSTQNITFTRAADTAIDFTYPATASNSKLLLIVFKNGGVAFVKKSVPSGGASGNIDLTAGVKFTANFKANEVEQILDGTITHKVINETSGTPLEIFSGTVTVEESGAPIVDYSQYAVQEYAQKKTFTEDGYMPLNLPAKSIVSQVIVKVNALGDTTSHLNCVVGSGYIVVDDYTLLDNGADNIVPIQPNGIIEAIQSSFSVALDEWDGAEIEVTVLFKTLPV